MPSHLNGGSTLAPFIKASNASRSAGLAGSSSRRFFQELQHVLRFLGFAANRSSITSLRLLVSRKLDCQSFAQWTKAARLE